MLSSNSYFRVYPESRRVGMADEADSKSVVGNYVWVQVPPPAVILRGTMSIANGGYLRMP